MWREGWSLGALTSCGMIHTVSASSQEHAVTASVLLDSKALPVRSPIGKVRSLWELVGKGKSREVQRIIQKGKSKVGEGARELDTMTLEIHLDSWFYILLFSQLRVLHVTGLLMHGLFESSLWIILECLSFCLFSELLFSPQNPTQMPLLL